MQKQEFIQYFQNIPVSVNNLYGDPFIQRDNTFKKLHNLKKSGHKGIVSIITKTEITEKDAERLKEYPGKLIILLSASELPFNNPKGACEPVPGNRYNTLKLCHDYNIPAIAYIRPFIPPFNTSEEVINTLFYKIAQTGIKNAVVAGIRGDDAIFTKSGIPASEREKWSYRVKKIPRNIRDIIDEKKEKYGINIFERTSCGVSSVLNLEYSYNPYYSAPQLCKCDTCPLKSTCFDKRDSFIPSEKDLELCEMLGYKAKLHIEKQGEMCVTNPENRTECMSCCTSCYMLKRSGIELIGDDIKLGDTSLIRLLTNKLAFSKGIYDTGRTDIGQPNACKDWYLLNSWWSYSRNIAGCYGCSYCIVTHYNNNNKEFGGVPIYEAEKFYNKKFA